MNTTGLEWLCNIVEGVRIVRGLGQLRGVEGLGCFGGVGEDLELEDGEEY